MPAPMTTTQRLGAETAELLQTLIRNACVNEGTKESGHEVRNAEVLTQVLEGAGLGVERFEAAPGRVSLVARIDGRNRSAPSLCLNGHTDVVPVNPDGWRNDPFGGELIDNEIWGRGAVDMLSLTASMAVVTRHLANSGFQPEGDLIFFAVADEESGSAYGARWMADNHPDVIKSTYALTENGGIHQSVGNRQLVSMKVGEKGVAWRRLRVRGTPGHGSRPFRADNALVKAARIVSAIDDHQTPVRLHELWRQQVESLGLSAEHEQMLMNADEVDAVIAEMPDGAASHLHSCCHMTMSPNVVVSPTKTNTIPDVVDIDIDVRTMPGETPDSVREQLGEALGPLIDDVEISPLMNDMSSMSPVDTPLWDALRRAVQVHFPSTELLPSLTVGFTDARVHRDLGAVAYGAGLLSPSLTGAEFGSRFHGNNERIDLESLELTTGLYLDTVTDLLS